MIEPILIITNNPMSTTNFKEKYIVEYRDVSSIELLKIVRDYVHLGHRILTHPLVSSIKPNEIPYRTVIISKKRDTFIDIDSLDIIEESISTTEKFLKDFGIPKWNEKILEDFKLIDYDLIFNVLK